MKEGKVDFLTSALSLHYQTQLLEAVNWDEEELESLSKFVVENIYKLGVEKLLESVEEKWGTNSKDVLNSIINLETFYLNLTTARSDDVN